MTLKKIAASAGVSVSTASKAFSGSSEISPDTKEKIFKAAKKLGCYEKYSKEKYPEKIIAVICPEINSEIYSSFIHNIDKEISRKNAVMVVSQYNFDHEKANRLFKYYSMFRKVDGIITFSETSEPDLSDIPAVSITSREKYIDSIYIDNSKAINDTVKYLKATGHKKIAFIGEELTVGKEKNFIDAMNKNGLSVLDKYIICEKKRFYDAGFYGMEHFFKKDVFPDAVVAAYDYIAIGAIRSIKAHGLRVPDDISVIGMDNISVCEDLDVPLTTISGNAALLSKKAVELLFEQFKSAPSDRKSIVVEAELIKRKSVNEKR